MKKPRWLAGLCVSRLYEGVLMRLLEDDILHHHFTIVVFCLFPPIQIRYKGTKKGTERHHKYLFLS